MRVRARRAAAAVSLEAPEPEEIRDYRCEPPAPGSACLRRLLATFYPSEMQENKHLLNSVVFMDSTTAVISASWTRDLVIICELDVINPSSNASF